MQATTVIQVEHNPDRARLNSLGVFDWDIWTRDVSRFPWTYDSAETCYLLDGDVIVTPDGGTPIRFGQGDLVIFPAGMSCSWDIRAPVRKHYRFD